MATIELTINGRKISTEEGTTILDAARKTGIYIPSLCSHPDVPATDAAPDAFVYQGRKKVYNENTPDPDYACNLCLIRIQGRDSPVRACRTIVESGMTVLTETDEIKKKRRNRFKEILQHHPNICLTCDRDPRCPPFGVCVRSANVPDRCVACPGYGDCELIRIADHIGMIGITIERDPIEFSAIDDNPFFEFDPNLCVGCTRCVRFCKEVRGINALGYVFREGRALAGTKAETFSDSGCHFCFGCVEICPTGALVDKKEKWKNIFEEDERKKSIVPCMAACPLQIDIPGYIHAVTEKNYDKSLSIIQEKLPFASLCGTVCTHPCETACRRGEMDEPVAIQGLKRFVVENAAPIAETPPVSVSGKKIAVVGSGPAGLSAAYYLRKNGGHGVTVFEARSEPGGMPLTGIPRFRLPKKILDSEISKLHQMGVEMSINQKVESIDDLINEGFDAVLLAVGAHGDIPLGIEGENHPSIMGAVQFLRRVNLNERVSLGEKVAVIGGGNVALDAARTAKRLGVKEVTIIYRRSLNEMPAHPDEIELAAAEGVQFTYLASPTLFEKSQAGIRIECIRYKLKRPDASGRRRPKPVKGSEFYIEVGSVITAVGQYPKVPEGLVSDKDAKGRVKVSEETFMTTRKWVFAAGDVVSGPKTVTEAIAMGAKAANAVNRYLGSEDNIDPGAFNPSKLPPQLEPGDQFMSKRTPMPHLPVEERGDNFEQVELGFTEPMALKEANRCLRCSLRLDIIKT